MTLKGFDRALACDSSAKCVRNKKPQGNDCKPLCQKLWETFQSMSSPNQLRQPLLFLHLLHYKTTHVQAAELLVNERLLPASPFLQAWGLHFALGARAQLWAWETETSWSEGQSFCYFCTSFSNSDEVAETEEMKAMVNFHQFGPKKSHEKLDFVVCGVTIRLHRHLHCCNHTVQETAVH